MATASPSGPARSRDSGGGASGPGASRLAGVSQRDGRRAGVDALHEVRALMAGGRSTSAIAGALVARTAAVEKHLNNIFTKLGRAPADRHHRRVLAVLRYLEAG